MKKLLAVAGLVALAACSNTPTEPVQLPEASRVRVAVPIPTCPPGQRPYVIWNGPGRPISYVCGPA